jgi:hypothetical protein
MRPQGGTRPTPHPRSSADVLLDAFTRHQKTSDVGMGMGSFAVALRPPIVPAYWLSGSCFHPLGRIGMSQPSRTAIPTVPVSFGSARSTKPVRTSSSSPVDRSTRCSPCPSTSFSSISRRSRRASRSRAHRRDGAGLSCLGPSGRSRAVQASCRLADPSRRSFLFPSLSSEGATRRGADAALELGCTLELAIKGTANERRDAPIFLTGELGQ